MHSLALVMPVYNEELCIMDVVDAWSEKLYELDIDFKMIILDDGSRDNTPLILKGLKVNDRIMLICKENSGHGPTLLSGYNLAVEMAEWVFQTDSDNEMKPGPFLELWQQRDSYDALFGTRSGRKQSFQRLLITVLSRAVVSLLYGNSVEDVNTPYRLMKSSVLAPIVREIPADTFAPNIIISGVLSSSRCKIFNHPVPWEGRRTGKVSLVRWGLWKGAITSFAQILSFRLKKCGTISRNKGFQH